MFTFVILSVIKISFVFFTSFSNSGYIVSFVLELVFFFEPILPILLLLCLLMKNIILVQILIFKCCVLKQAL